MHMIELGFILFGLMGLLWGSDYSVNAAREIARKLRISELIVGLTIVSIGTSVPEIATNLLAGFSTLSGVDASGIAVGSIIGSELAQITLLLGIVGFMATLHIPQRCIVRDGFMLFMAAILMYLTAIDGFVSRSEGVLLVLTYIIYLAYLVTQERTKVQRVPEEARDYDIGADALKTIIGISVVVLGAHLIVKYGVVMALRYEISESVIGLFVGLGTSLPELTVSLRAIHKSAGSLSLGNLIGSNITDPLLSFGLGASIAGVTVEQIILKFDFVYWITATAIALLLLYNHMNLNRKESSILIILYGLFLYLRLTFFWA